MCLILSLPRPNQCVKSSTRTGTYAVYFFTIVGKPLNRMQFVKRPMITGNWCGYCFSGSGNHRLETSLNPTTREFEFLLSFAIRLTVRGPHTGIGGGEKTGETKNLSLLMNCGLTMGVGFRVMDCTPTILLTGAKHFQNLAYFFTMIYKKTLSVWHRQYTGLLELTIPLHPLSIDGSIKVSTYQCPYQFAKG